MRFVLRTLGRASGLAAAFFAGAVATGSARADGDDTYRSLAVFARVLNYVENNYVSAVAPEDLIYGAIRGMLATLDPHSVFLDPAQYAAMKTEAQGEFGGIGVELVKRDDGVEVVERYPEAPAIRAGLEVDDRIVAVDGETVVGRSLAEVVQRIKGPAGSAVVLSVVRGAKALQLSVVRDRIRVVSVSARRLAGGHGYVRIRSFTERTATDLLAALDGLEKAGPLPGLVLDVRDNPGGLLDEAVRVADAWLREGVIVSTEGRGRAPDRELAHPRGTEPNYPIAVLVNGGTASAAEIVAGALQDHQRGVVIGTQTFGKGSVQTVIELEDQSALKLTIARYFTPKHRSIAGTGITPDIVVPHRPKPLTTASVAPDVAAAGHGDPQLDAAVEYLERRRRGL